MNTYGERLEEALRQAGCERKALCGAIGITLQALGQVISGKTKALTAENSARAAKFLRVDHFWLATGEGVARPQEGGDPPPIPSLSHSDWLLLPSADQDEVLTLLAGKVARYKKKSNAA